MMLVDRDSATHLHVCIPPLAHNDEVDRSSANHLLRLLSYLIAADYQFITPSPATHERILARGDTSHVSSLRDIFGWNKEFRSRDISVLLLELMANAQILRSTHKLRSAVRIARIENDLFLHSSFPTTDDSSVFFGPDTYRFVRFVRDFIEANKASFALRAQQGAHRIIDIGCGCGAGGIVAARALAKFGHDHALTLSDINPLALQYAATNAEFAHIPVTLCRSDSFEHISGEFDLIIVNPPYLQDQAQRLYRHGGDDLGRGLSVRLATEALAHLAPGGTLLLYSGVAIVDGVDHLLKQLQLPLQHAGVSWSYAEIDPDVFGEELALPAYRQVDRIAVVGLTATRPWQRRV